MTKSKGVGRGGVRAGAGRKSMDGAALVGSATISMDDDTEALFYELGHGNYSLGARRAAAELLMYRKGHTPLPEKVLQPIAKRRGGLRSPTPQEELPIDPRAVYD